MPSTPSLTPAKSSFAVIFWSPRDGSQGESADQLSKKETLHSITETWDSDMAISLHHTAELYYSTFYRDTEGGILPVAFIGHVAGQEHPIGYNWYHKEWLSEQCCQERLLQANHGDPAAVGRINDDLRRCPLPERGGQLPVGDNTTK